MVRKMLFLSLNVFFFFSLVLGGVQGTLIPNGTVSLDCGSQQTFTCSINSPSVGWTISGLSGVEITTQSGVSASMDTRISTTDTRGVVPSSNITITGFNTTDNGGTIQCIDLDDINLPVDGVATISVERPSCPTSFSANRDGDFTSVYVTYQLATPPPVTSTTVTYYSNSSNTPNSTDCTSPCTISGLDPCVEYNVSATPNNNCESAMGCTENSMLVPAKGVPSCPSSVVAVAHDDGDAITVTWQQPVTPPIANTTVTYCPTSSPNCGNSTNCTHPCTISGLDPGTEYQFTVIPNNNCGSPTGCTGNTATARISTGSEPLPVWVIIIIVIVVIIILISIIVAVVFIVICCCCAVASAWLIATCCCCCKQANKNRNKSERLNQPQEEYVDPKKVREKKDKEEKIQYAALEFSEQAGSSGEKKVHSKEEPVQYFDVEQA